MKPREIRELDTYLEIKPFGVLIDESEELKSLASRARDFKTLQFTDKLNKVKDLVLSNMENAYEGMYTHPDPRMREIMQGIVYEEHPLSYALAHKAGCCRYQGVLFFVLGFESELGIKHLLQSATVTENLHTVFNDVFDDNGNLHRVNIFTESLKDKRYDYSNANPKIYDNIDIFWPGLLFYSYQKRGEKTVILESLDAHA